ncbi:MAG: glycosyl transferase, partial [Steroidobacteraceae bacterium]
LNPVKRSAVPDDARLYRVEPYVLAADIYAGDTLAGRGGWTWYTGAAGWYYRAVLECVLGIRIIGDTLTIAPCVPPEWQDFEVVLKQPQIDYVIRMKRGNAADVGLFVDGERVAGESFPLHRDALRHVVEINLA